MQPAVHFADIKVQGKRGDGFRANAAAVIGAQRQRAGDDALYVSRVGDDLFGGLGDSRVPTLRAAWRKVVALL